MRKDACTAYIKRAVQLRRNLDASTKRPITVVCNYSPTCNGTGNCLKCPHLTKLKIVDLQERCQW